MSMITDDARLWAAKPFEAREFRVSRTDIRRFADAIGASDPVHHQVAAARDAGYPDLLAPPYFPYVIRMHVAHLGGRDRITADGSPAEEVPPIAATRAMAGETEISFGDPVFAGDTITLHKQIDDLYEKQGRSGPMAFVKTRFSFRNQHDRMVMREVFTRIYR